MKELTGTEKQIRWAEDIRAGIVDMYNHALAHIDYNLADEDDASYIEEFTQRRERYVRQFSEILETKTAAAWWIDHRVAPAFRHPMDNDVSYNMECAGLFDRFIKRAFRNW